MADTIISRNIDPVYTWYSVTILDYVQRISNEPAHAQIYTVTSWVRRMVTLNIATNNPEESAASTFTDQSKIASRFFWNNGNYTGCPTS
jgi:hypothetical protein